MLETKELNPSAEGGEKKSSVSGNQKSEMYRRSPKKWSQTGIEATQAQYKKP